MTTRYATLRGADKTGNAGGDIKETQMMWDAYDLRHDFTTVKNNISFLVNKVKLVLQQTLQHGHEADLCVRCDVLLLLWH